ncbi:MAG: DMT family transporter [Pseudomonadota bacterium]
MSERRLAARSPVASWSGVAAAVAACALIAATSLMAKVLGGEAAGEAALHPLQISAGRFVFALLAVSVAFAILRPGFEDTPWRLHAARSACGWVGVTCLFAASTQIPLADATAISFLSPIFTIGFAVFLLREAAAPAKLIGSAIALLGAVLLLAPGEEGLRLAAFIALAAAAVMGLESIFIKRLSGREPPVRILFANNLIGAAIAATAAAFVWRAPTAEQWTILAAVGLTMACAQALFIQAMKRGEAGRIAPLLNATLVFAALYDFALFGEVPTVVALIGAALIIAGVLVAARR